MSKCKFCGSTAFGGCMNSPHGKHEHQQIGDRCVYCGSTAYGGCINSPTRKHKHESGYGKCVYCGSTAYGGCTMSPSGKHEQRSHKKPSFRITVFLGGGSMCYNDQCIKKELHQKAFFTPKDFIKIGNHGQKCI